MTPSSYDAANVVGNPKQRAVITQEVIPVAVFEVATSVNNQLFIRRDQRSVVVNHQISIDRNILTGNQTIGVVYNVRRQSRRPFQRSANPYSCRSCPSVPA